MEETIVKIFAWISSVLYTIMSSITLLILFLENMTTSSIVSFTILIAIFFGMAKTGWNATRYDLISFKRTKLTTATAIFSLIFGIILGILSPFIFARSYGIGDSYESIIVLLIMFTPAVVTSVAILSKHNNAQID